MSNFLVFVLFIVGFILIVKGGDWFVDSSVRIAEETGIPKILIGATIVSLATTLPELLVSVVASLRGAPDMAIGNAIGSTICNIGLILGITALFLPGKIEGAFKSKGILMILSTTVLIFFARDRIITKFEGIFLLALLVYYIYLNLKEVKECTRSKKSCVTNYEEALDIVDEGIDENNGMIKIILQFIGGAAGIVIGARLLVDNGIIIAEMINVPEQVISLTIIALGTSLPELVTAITAIRKKCYSISVGNIIGANILNITMILGFSSIIAKQGLIISTRDIDLFGKVFENVVQTLYIDIPISLILMFMVVIPVIVSKQLKRYNGIMMLLTYFVYIVFLAVSSI